jgi:hypothetical protein
MGSFLQSAFQLFFIVGYTIILVISIIILKPFRVHRKRPVSTISLKTSFLAHLIFFLIFTYLLLFGKKELSETDIPFDTLFNLHFLIFLSAAIIPVLGIMIRRSINKKRIEFNVIFTIINICYSIYLLYAVLSHKWALL